MNGRGYTSKGQSLENGLSWVFQAGGNILLQNERSQHDEAEATEQEDQS